MRVSARPRVRVVVERDRVVFFFSETLARRALMIPPRQAPSAELLAAARRYFERSWGVVAPEGSVDGSVLSQTSALAAFVRPPPKTTENAPS